MRRGRVYAERNDTERALDDLEKAEKLPGGDIPEVKK